MPGQSHPVNYTYTHALLNSDVKSMVAAQYKLRGEGFRHSINISDCDQKFENKNLDWLLEAPCDILIPAARPDAITAKNIDRIDCRIILEGANSPTSKPVEYYLKHRRNILSVTDFIVNAGGVIGCAVEQKLMQDKDYASKVKIKNTRNYTENLILKTISTNVIEIFSRIRKDNVFRDAATELALERLQTKEIWL